MKNSNKKHATKLGVYFSVNLFIIVLLFTYSIHTSLPTNALDLPFAESTKIMTWFPQGWGFYSKDPREEGIYLYDFHTQKRSTNWPHNTAVNLFGLKRTGRAQGIEAGLLKSQIPFDNWVACEESPFTCGAKQEEDMVTITNTTPIPSICGDQLFVMQEPIPWAWSKYKDSITMPSRIARVNVECSKN